MSDRPISTHPDGVLARVWVVARASRSEIKGSHDGRVEIRVAVPPEAGRANEEAIRVLTDRFGVSVELVSGATGRQKVFLAHDIGFEEAAAKLSL